MSRVKDTRSYLDSMAYDRGTIEFFVKPMSRVKDWLIDREGSIAHECVKGSKAWGKTVRIFSPISGIKERTCMRCGDTCTNEVEMLSQLRRLGDKRSGSHT